MQKTAAFLLLLSLGALGWWAHAAPGGRVPAFALVCGAVLGIAMQRSRFWFFCHIRDWLEEDDPRGVLAILLAIAVGLVGHTVVLGAWMPEPKPGILPPDMHIGPVSWVLVAAGLAFGFGMVISGSCISAHFYRLAEGSPKSPFALIGAGAGFVLGFKSWNGLYSLAVADAPTLWLPAHLGYGGALLLQLGVLALLGAWAWRGFARKTANGEKAEDDGHSRQAEYASLAGVWRRLWQEPWAYWTGGLIVGLTGAFAVVRMKPLGATGSLGSFSRALSGEWGWIPVKLNGLDGFAGCASVPQGTWLTTDNFLLLGLVGGALVGALAGARYAPRRPAWKDAARGLAGGVLLGWGAMTGLGCTLGTLLSGTQAGALSGWVFGAAMLCAIWIGLKIENRLARPG
jgi:uncharacterized membrane protein YedE/YeeE